MTEDSNAMNGDEAKAPQPIFSIHLFQILDQAQSFHGVPSQDYDQYHQYCTKRLQRIRHHKEVRSLLTHNPKYRSSEAATAGGGRQKRNAYCPRPVPERVPHEYVLYNLLFQAERAWAVACATPRHGTARRRFNKAVHWAQRLFDTLQRCADATTQREGRAYLAWMKGNQALESKDYATAFRQYTASRTALLQLASQLQRRQQQQQQSDGDNGNKDDDDDDDVDKLALSDLWTTRAETVLKPLIRFCQYEAKDKLEPSEVQGWDTAQNKQVDSAKKSTDNSMLLEFRNQTVDLENYPQLAVLYLKMEEVLDDESAQKDEKVFLQLLSDLDDALGIVATENSRYASLPAGPAVTAKRSELATLKSFFTYHKLQLQRRHQEDSLAESSNDTTEESVTGLFHFYDALQQNAQAVADLAGQVTNDEDGYNPEDDPHWLEAQAHVVRIRAFRCYYLARLYETVLNGTTAQVLALLRQARVLQRRAAEEVAACELDGYLPGLQDLKTKIATLQCRMEASRYLEVVGASTGIRTTRRPLWQRIHDLDAGPVLADDPPVTIPLPCKPTFFDLAGTLVAEGVPTEALDEYIRENEPKKEKSGGLFGWFS